MTSFLAIAAVTARIRNVLEQGLEKFPGIEVTTLPLNQASEDIPEPGRVNLFLYEVEQNSHWRNGDIPWQVRPGETGKAPLALNLYYLLTIFHGRSQPAPGIGLPIHQQLGLAMSILHDRPVFNPAEIRAELNNLDLSNLDINNLDLIYDQIDNVRITPGALPFEQLLRLFESSQTPYAISVAYQVSVVLIQSKVPAQTPLPVLTIGENDRGVQVIPSLIPPFPTLESLVLPNEQASIQLGDLLVLRGHHLDGEEGVVRFRNLRRSQDISLTPLAGSSATEVSIQINPIEDQDEPPEDWMAGFYNVSFEVIREGKLQRTNELSFSIAPSINNANLVLNPPVPSEGEIVSLTLECTPAVQPNQQVSLLFGNLEIPPVSSTDFPTSTLTFEFEAPTPGRYFVRLRVDGVDSLLIMRTEATQDEPSRLIFNPQREVVIP